MTQVIRYRASSTCPLALDGHPFSMMQHLHQEFLALAHALGAQGDLCMRVDAGVVHLEQRTGSKGALLGARLRVEAAQPIAPYAILLRPEGALDRAGKQLAINREVQLGDPAFDEQVYIETDGQDDDVRRILAGPAVRQAVRAIVTPRIESLTIGGDSPEAVLVPTAHNLHVDFPKSAFGDVAGLHALANMLARLAIEIVRAQPQGPYRGDLARAPIKPPAKDRMGRGFALFFVCVAMHVMAWFRVGFGSTPPTFGWRAFGVGAIGGVVGWFLFVFVTALLLRGRSTSLRNVLIVALLALPIIIVGGRAAESINAGADPSAPHVVLASVRLRPQSKGPSRKEVTLTSTKEHVDVDEAHTFGVPFDYAPRAVEATIRDGALGSPHLVRLAYPAPR